MVITMLMFNEILFFPVVTVIEDELGQQIRTEDYSRMVFCDEKSIAQNEFFSAGQSGIKAARKLIVNSGDYQEEVKLKYKDKIYNIYRTYTTEDEKTELYCEFKVGG